MMISELPLQTTGLHPYEAMQLPILTPILTLDIFRLFRYVTFETQVS